MAERGSGCSRACARCRPGRCVSDRARWSNCADRRRSGSARLMEQLGASLPPWRRRIDVIVLTHAHLDHGAGLLAALDRYEIGMTLEPAGLNPGALTDLWAAGIARARSEERRVGKECRSRWSPDQ